MDPSDRTNPQATLQTIGFAVQGENRSQSYVWVEASSIDAARERLAPLFPGCTLAPLLEDSINGTPAQA